MQPNVTIFASGELADEPKLCESLSAEMGYPVSLLSSPLKCPKQMDLTNYLVNVGLALKELRREAGPLLANVNTLPVAYQPKQISLVKVLILPSVAVAIGVIFILTTAIQDASAGIASAQEQLDSNNSILKQRQTQKKELTDKITKLESKVAETEAARNLFVTTFNGLEQKGTSFNSDLKVVIDKLVSGMEVGSIGHSGDRLSLSGNSTSEAEVLQYARNLDSCGRFSEVVILGMSRVYPAGTANSTGSDAMNFALSVKVK